MTAFIVSLMLAKSTPSIPGFKPVDLCYANGRAVKCQAFNTEVRRPQGNLGRK